MNKNILFQPLTLKNGFTFKNRFVKPAMSEIMGDKAHLGVDLIDISGGNYENTMIQGSNKNGAFFVKYAAKAKKEIDTPIIVTDGFRTMNGENALANNETDMIGLARVMVLLPDLPNKAAQSKFKEINIEMRTTGFKALDKKVGSYIGLSYYEMLMAKIAADKGVKCTKMLGNLYCLH